MRKKMIGIKTLKVDGWEPAIIGMRNPMNSWDKSDSKVLDYFVKDEVRTFHTIGGERGTVKLYELSLEEEDFADFCGLIMGEGDLKLMKRLALAGSDHAKYRRMITVYCDITAPLYWWKEFDTYKVGTVANSCSTMHKIQEKEFTLDDFSCEHLMDMYDMVDDYDDFLEHGYDAIREDAAVIWIGNDIYTQPFSPRGMLVQTIHMLNRCRDLYLKTGDKKYWWQMIQSLPSSYDQKRTVMLNYEVLSNIYHARKNHKLDEWHDFCAWIENLPYAKEIIFPDIAAKEEEWVTKYCENDVNDTKEAFNKLKTAFEGEHK